MKRARALLLAVLLSPTWSTASAGPQASVERGLALDSAGRLSEAREVLERALIEGGHDARTLRDVYLHLGILRAGARDREGAIAAFSAVLSLDPSLEEDASWSPVIAEPFRAALRSHPDRAPIEVVVEGPREIEAGSHYSGVVHVKNDAAALARVARVRVWSPERAEVLAHGPAPMLFVLPGELTRGPGEVRYQVELLDAYGSTLAASGSDAKPVLFVVRESNGAPPDKGTPELASLDTATAAPRLGFEPRVLPPESLPAAPSPSSDESIWTSPWLWGSTAALIAGAITVGLILASESGGAEVSAPRVVLRR
jgi:hypothetical protein